ncbi:hypothetical protein [Terrabacter sp. NPDC000476]|uniref:hypothetical protein n=1 Tax=Terrabacter sp. NPDC000476 TaxID=3154258 RepID=UPI00332F2973
MGFSTRYLGRLDITPRLNDAEIEWLVAYAEVDRRHLTDPYEVPMNPRALRTEEYRQAQQGASLARGPGRGTWVEGVDPFTTLTPVDGSPYPHLDWTPCPEGCCLGWDARTEKSRMAEDWLQYLIDQFFRPGAVAGLSGRPDFDRFTFDHVLNGTIAAERDDTRELWLIRCVDNEISTEMLVGSDPLPWDGVARLTGPIPSRRPARASRTGVIGAPRSTPARSRAVAVPGR